MTWFYLALSSVFFFVALGLLQRTIAIDSKNPRYAMIIFSFFSIIFALFLFIFSGDYKKFSFPATRESILVLFIASLFYGLYDRLRFRVNKIFDASTFSILSTVSAITAFFISFIIYQEALTLKKVLGFFLVIMSILLIFSGKKLEKISLKEIFLGVLIFVFLGIAWSLDKKGSQIFTPETYNILIWTAPFIFIVFPLPSFETLKKEFKISSWRVPLISFFNVAGYFLQLKALSFGEATRVIPIVQSSILIIVIMGIFLLNEKKNMKKKIIAGFLTLLGVYLLV